MTMTASQALRDRILVAVTDRSAPDLGAVSDEVLSELVESITRAVQRLTVASVGSLIALGTRPIEELGGIDGDPGDDPPSSAASNSSAASAA